MKAFASKAIFYPLETNGVIVALSNNLSFLSKVALTSSIIAIQNLFKKSSLFSDNLYESVLNFFSITLNVTMIS